MKTIKNIINKSLLNSISVGLSLLLSMFSNISNAQTSKKDNYFAFASIYSYVKYFYPDSTLQKTNWDFFLLQNISKIEECKNKQELYDSLTEIFSGIKYLQISSVPIENIKQKELSKKIYWQHIGNGIDISNPIYSKITPYISKIIYSKKEQLFDGEPKINGINFKILDSVYFFMPIVLENSPNCTLQYDTDRGNNKNIDIADFITEWAALKHFYPYRDEINFDTIFYNNVLKYDNGFVPLDFLLEEISDGHAFNKLHFDFNKTKQLPFRVKKINQKYIISNSLISDVKIGDELLDLNEETVSDLEVKFNEVISGSKQIKEYRLLHIFLGLDTLNYCHIKTIHKNDTINLKVQKSQYNYSFKIDNYKKEYKVIEKINKFYYVDLTRVNWGDLEKSLNEISSSKGVIFDLRGYPTPQNHQILSYLPLKKRNLKAKLFSKPLIVYPNYAEVKYDSSGWDLDKKNPILKNKIIFLINSQTISYAESIVSFLKGTNITLIGQPTAGANGDIKSIILPSNKEIWYTGIVCKLLDGQIYHYKGIEPDIIVNETISGIKNGIDEVIEIAIDFLSE